MPSGMSGAIAMLDGRQRAAMLDAVDGDAAVQWLRAAVQTPSITGNEMAFAALVASELETCGADEVHVEEVLPDRPIVWSVTRGAGGGPSVMLAGHLDTVRVDGWADRWRGTEREDPFSGAIVDGAVWGRGSGDLKAGITTAVAALRSLQRSGTSLRGDVITVWVCDEESGEPGLGRSVGMRAVAERLGTDVIPSVDFAIYLEPTGLAVYAAQIGFSIAEISLEGRSAYFGRPEEGVDALRAGHAVLSALWECDAELRSRPAHALLGSPALLVTEARAGGYIAVPGSCKLTVIRTLVPPEELSQAATEIEAVVRRAIEGTGVHATMTFPAGRDHPVGGLPAQTDPQGPGVQALRDAVRAIAPDRAVVGGAPYWSEMSYLHAAGIPCVYWAPGDILNCHTSEEHVDVDELLDGVRALSLFLTDYCGFGRTRGGEGS
jgi:acetylornithine deacetylase